MAKERGVHPLYCCKNCRNPLAFADDLISKAYKAKTGQAFMFSHVMNIVYGKKEDRPLITGMYTISPIFCNNCSEELGWYYLRAYEATSKFKEGKFILEKSKLIKEY